MVFRRGCPFDDFEEAELEPAIHVGEDVLRYLFAVLERRVAAILKGGQFIEPVLGDEPAAKIRAAFIGLKAAGHEQRELPAVPYEREVSFNEELEQIPVAGALALKAPAEELLVALVILLLLAPASGKLRVRFQFLGKPLV